MNYGNTFVASISLDASRAQAVRALAEADAFDGPSVVIAYAAGRGDEATGHGDAADSAAAVVDSGGAAADSGAAEIGAAAAAAAATAVPWPLYRWNPERGDEPFQVDSKSLRKDLEKFTERVSHLSLLAKKEQASATNFTTSLEANYEL